MSRSRPNVSSGRITWINQRGGVYTLALSQEYSRTRMPEGAKGTPEHAQLVMRYYTYNNIGGTTMLSGNGGADAGGPFWIISK